MLQAEILDPSFERIEFFFHLLSLQPGTIEAGLLLKIVPSFLFPEAKFFLGLFLLVLPFLPSEQANKLFVYMHFEPVIIPLLIY